MNLEASVCQKCNLEATACRKYMSRSANVLRRLHSFACRVKGLCYELLELALLLFELAQFAEFCDAHLPELRFPAVKGLLTDAGPQADLCN